MEYTLKQVGKFRIELEVNGEEYMVKNRSIDEINNYLEMYGFDDYFRENWIEPQPKLWEIM